MGESDNSRGWRGLGAGLMLTGFPLALACMVVGVGIALAGGYVDWGSGFFGTKTVSPSILDSRAFRATCMIWIMASIALLLGVFVTRWDQGRSIFSGEPKPAHPKKPTPVQRGVVTLIVVAGIVILSLEILKLCIPQLRTPFMERVTARGWSEPPPLKLKQFLELTGIQWDAQRETHRKQGKRIPEPSFVDLEAVLLHAVRAARASWGAQDKTIVELEKLYLTNGSKVLYAGALLQYLVDKAPAGWVQKEVPVAVAAVQANLGSSPNKINALPDDQGED